MENPKETVCSHEFTPKKVWVHKCEKCSELHIEQDGNNRISDEELQLHEIIPLLELMSKTLDRAIENLDADNKDECNKISDVVELLTGIAEDNGMFVRN